MDNSFPKAAVLGTGLSGLVGSTFVDVFKDRYDFTNLDLLSGVDITNEEQVMKAAELSTADTIVHFAAFVDATRAWQEKGDKNGVCYKVNVLGTQNMANAATRFNKHFVHISTAYIFDGEKEGMYSEDDKPHPIEWYGETKALAEEVVQNTVKSWTIFRIDQPFRQTAFSTKPDSVRKIIQAMQGGTLYPQFTDHWFAPTYLNDFALALDWAIQKKPQGIFHATVNERVSDFEFTLRIQAALKLPGEVQRGALDTYLKTLQRPYQRNTALASDKLRKESGLAFQSLNEALASLII